MYFVYEVYDSDTHLLYVGVTSDMKTRFTLHKCKSPWYELIYEIKSCIVDCKKEALALERTLISTKNPVYNIYKRDELKDKKSAALILQERMSRWTEIAELRRHGMTYQEIGDIMGVSRQCVHQMINRYYKHAGVTL